MEFTDPVKMILIEVAVALLLFSSPSAGAASTAHNETKLVKEVCEHAKMWLRYEDCVDVLYGDFRTGSIKDLKALTFLALDLAMVKTSEAMGYIKGMLEKPLPALKPALEGCAGQFDYSYHAFHSATGDLASNDSLGREAANYDVMIARDGAVGCRQAMQYHNVTIPAGVAARCGYIEFFSHLCMAITDMLGKA